MIYINKTNDNMKIDKNNISYPEVFLSDFAKSQLSLILENDFTLKGKYLRVLISGKGCDGFTYSIGFADFHQDDLNIPVKNDDNLEVIMDPFTAFYLRETHIDYVQDLKNGDEGFVVTNKDQKKYHGKFWRKDDSLVPSLTK